MNSPKGDSKCEKELEVAIAKEIEYLAQFEVRGREELERHYTADDLDAAWWDGYSTGTKDSAEVYLIEVIPKQ
ncbi:MAG: hypothetical protein M3247_08675 [Thermoproteota archaeon]|nr:hypothetical protein [Thermoproteota archaeon]